MSIRLSLRANGYRIKADVTFPPGRLKAQDMLPAYREISDATTNAMVVREKYAGNSISCKKGCSACCKRIYVEVTEAEAYRLNHIINCMPEGRRQHVEKRFALIRQKLVDNAMYDEIMTLRVHDQSRPRLCSNYCKLKIECPFLENDACSIYQERPLACREYLVTSPAEECAKPKNGEVKRVSFVSSAIGYAMRMTQNPSSDSKLVPLVLLRSWVKENPEPSPKFSGVELLKSAVSGASYSMQTSLNAEAPQNKTTKTHLTTDEINANKTILPDYQQPDALMVPHYGLASIDMIENIATTAARSIGVILLTPDPDRTCAFVEKQPDPERYSILTAASDTAWIRDRAPIAVKCEDENIQWYLPRLPDDERRADAELFNNICARPVRTSPFTLASGNLVTGPAGIALSTHQIIEQNNVDGLQGFQANARQLGIRRWIVFPSFTEEMTRHADVCVRFLEDNLAAVAWNLSVEKDREIADDLVSQLEGTLPGLRVLKLPIRSEDEHYASTLNWIQLGKNLILPKYELNTKEDLSHTKQLLETEGFKPVFINSPTLDTGGSLHCLTASIYL